MTTCVQLVGKGGGKKGGGEKKDRGRGKGGGKRSREGGRQAICDRPVVNYTILFAFGAC